MRRDAGARRDPSSAPRPPRHRRGRRALALARDARARPPGRVRARPPRVVGDVAGRARARVRRPAGDRGGSARLRRGRTARGLTTTRSTGPRGRCSTYLDARGIARAALVGNSLGGAVAMLIAAEHPERITHLVLVVAGDGAGADQVAGRAFCARGASEKLALAAARRPFVAYGLRHWLFAEAARVTDASDRRRLDSARRSRARAARRWPRSGPIRSRFRGLEDTRPRARRSSSGAPRTG